MFYPLQLFIGLRYTRAKRRNHFISFISLVSMLGIAVGVAALIAVMSVMNGFQGDMQERILGMVAHASIESVDGGIVDWRDTVQKVEANPHVVGAAPYLDAQALLRGRRTSAAVVHGLVPEQEPRVSNIGDKLLKGSLADLKPGSFNVILGNELAMQLGVRVGDKVTVMVPEFSVTPVGAVPRSKNCEVVGVFSVGFAEYDTGVALMNMDDAITLLRADGPGGIRLKLDDMFDAYKIAVGLRDHLGQYFRITTWEQSHQNFFSAVKMEKTVMFIILSLIVGVAAFNLVSTLIMLVTDKQADIAILRTLGISPNKVMGIFTVQGVIVGSFGILLGLVGGVLLAWYIPDVAKWIEHTFHFEILPADIYYINEVPSDLHWSDVGWVAAIAWVFCLLATLYPAWRAARTQPAAALRYE
ncbi:MAG: lipoprotein-releasing ABC transporter permease subunit [Proteobacteria bacterium]|uniref:lipoprotein-releasing ABC transporter permease subunit n=1 Tax=Rudaea sp. TaxID=2136325 RepID=UPI0037839A56|nr:lipoprotein-releasing ABC transporter permease subunit [Pseudomonadota bacterium]